MGDNASRFSQPLIFPIGYILITQDQMIDLFLVNDK